MAFFVTLFYRCFSCGEQVRLEGTTDNITLSVYFYQVSDRQCKLHTKTLRTDLKDFFLLLTTYPEYKRLEYTVYNVKAGYTVHLTWLHSCNITCNIWCNVWWATFGSVVKLECKFLIGWTLKFDSLLHAMLQTVDTQRNLLHAMLQK